MNLNAVLQPPFEVLVKRNNNHLYTKDGPGKINVCFTVYQVPFITMSSSCLSVAFLSCPSQHVRFCDNRHVYVHRPAGVL